jgi:hypothetical protein
MQKRCNVVGVLVVLMASLSCTRNNELNKIRAGDFSIVYKDTYRGRLKFLGRGGEYERLVKQLRTDIERDEMFILEAISDRFHMIPHKEYEFKFAAYDDTSDHLVLRYFARIVEHTVYAGYQIQFVFLLSSHTLLKVFTSEVPLE